MINYSKIFMTIFCLFFLSNGVFAETWKNASMENNKTVFIDIDSVNSHNDSIYYNVKYLNEGGFEEISTIQSQGIKACIVATCKYTDYLKDKSCANPLTISNLSVLNDISVKSFLYNANETAKLTIFKKTHKSNILTTGLKKNEKDELSDNLTGYRQKITNHLSNSLNTQNINKNQGFEVTYFHTPNIENGELASSYKSYQSKLYNIWNQTLNKGKKSKKVVVLITFDKMGELISCLLIKSSGDNEADEAAITAVRRVGNFGKLPKDFKDENLDINFTFDYKVIEIN